MQKWSEVLHPVGDVLRRALIFVGSLPVTSASLGWWVTLPSQSLEACLLLRHEKNWRRESARALCFGVCVCVCVCKCVRVCIHVHVSVLTKEHESPLDYILKPLLCVCCFSFFSSASSTLCLCPQPISLSLSLFLIDLCSLSLSLWTCVCANGFVRVSQFFLLHPSHSLFFAWVSVFFAHRLLSLVSRLSLPLFCSVCVCVCVCVPFSVSWLKCESQHEVFYVSWWY